MNNDIKEMSSEIENQIYIRRYNDPIIKLTSDIDADKYNKVIFNNIDESSIEITLFNNDHAIANLIQKSLVKDNRVEFIGYRMIHPLENKILIKLKLKEKEKIKPKELLDEHILILKDTMKTLKNEFINSL
jgi:DNA-directed RNA polymerase subunit L